jgi:hypothetical protein
VIRRCRGGADFGLRYCLGPVDALVAKYREVEFADMGEQSLGREAGAFFAFPRRGRTAVTPGD